MQHMLPEHEMGRAKGVPGQWKQDLILLGSGLTGLRV